jgi:hypothetical protein
MEQSYFTFRDTIDPHTNQRRSPTHSPATTILSNSSKLTSSNSVIPPSDVPGLPCASILFSIEHFRSTLCWHHFLHRESLLQTMHTHKEKKKPIFLTLSLVNNQNQGSFKLCWLFSSWSPLILVSCFW